MKRKSECRLSLVSRADKEYLPTSMRFTRPRANGETWRTDDKSAGPYGRTDSRPLHDEPLEYEMGVGRRDRGRVIALTRVRTRWMATIRE